MVSGLFHRSRRNQVEKRFFACCVLAVASSAEHRESEESVACTHD